MRAFDYVTIEVRLPVGSGPFGIVADGNPSAIAVLLSGLASNLYSNRKVHQCQCCQPSTWDGFSWPLARLLRLRSIDAVQPDALTGYLNSVTIDNTGLAGDVGGVDWERQE